MSTINSSPNFNKWLYLSLIALGGVTWSAYSHFHDQAVNLEKFCQTVPIGATDVEVRKSAQALGFTPTMEPFAQMRIQPWEKLLPPPSCRVFFNRARTVEYRVLEQS